MLVEAAAASAPRLERVRAIRGARRELEAGRGGRVGVGEWRCSPDEALCKAVDTGVGSSIGRLVGRLVGRRRMARGGRRLENAERDVRGARFASNSCSPTHRCTCLSIDLQPASTPFISYRRSVSVSRLRSFPPRTPLRIARSPAKGSLSLLIQLAQTVVLTLSRLPIVAVSRFVHCIHRHLAFARNALRSFVSLLVFLLQPCPRSKSLHRPAL